MSDWQTALVPLLEQSEGFRSEPYQDRGGRWTVGFGSTFLPSGAPVTGTTPAVSIGIARGYYLSTCLQLHAAVLAHDANGHLDSGKEAALVDFTYNLGLGDLLGSTLWRDFQAGNITAAAAQFVLWDHEKVNGSEIQDEGLLKRRKAEAALFTRGY